MSELRQRVHHRLEAIDPLEAAGRGPLRPGILHLKKQRWTRTRCWSQQVSSTVRGSKVGPVAGSVLLGFGLCTHFCGKATILHRLDKAPSTFYFGGVTALVVMGSLIMLLGFLNFSGAILESRAMLKTFLVCLLMTFTAEMAVGFWALRMNNEQVPKEMKTFYDRKYSEYNKSGSKLAQKSLLELHNMLECCGKNDDFKQYLVNNVCSKTDATLRKIASRKDCHDSIDEMLSSVMSLIVGVMIGIGVLNVLEIVLNLVVLCFLLGIQQQLIDWGNIKDGPQQPFENNSRDLPTATPVPEDICEQPDENMYRELPGLPQIPEEVDEYPDENMYRGLPVLPQIPEEVCEPLYESMCRGLPVLPQIPENVCEHPDANV